MNMLSPDLSIGQAAAASGVSAKMIRYYESIGLVRGPVRSASNYRRYDRAAIRNLRFIARARGLGFSVKDIGGLLVLWQEPGRSSADVRRLAVGHLADLDRRIAAMRGIRAALEQVVAQCHGDGRPDCPILDELSEDRPPAGGPNDV